MNGARALAGLDSSFHTVDRVLKSRKDDRLVTAEPDEPVTDALKRMIERRLNQLPVFRDGERVGVFSLWSLARYLVAFPQARVEDLRVAHAIIDIPLVRPEDSLLKAAARLKTEDAVLVCSDEGTTDILTDEDLVGYFHAQSKRFIIVQEFELGLRHLIGSRLTELEVREAFLESSNPKYREDPPERIDRLDFSDYPCLLKAYWGRFESLLGEPFNDVIRRLDLVRKLRNDALHFRESSEGTSFILLGDQRDWLYRRLRSGRIPLPAGSEPKVVAKR